MMGGWVLQTKLERLFEEMWIAVGVVSSRIDGRLGDMEAALSDLLPRGPVKTGDDDDAGGGAVRNRVTQTKATRREVCGNRGCQVEECDQELYAEFAPE